MDNNNFISEDLSQSFSPVIKQGGYFLPIIGILIILLLIAGGGYYLVKSKSSNIPFQTPTSTQKVGPSPMAVDETVNWKTYTNSNLGFSIRYPDNIDFNEKKFGDVVFFFKEDDDRNKTSSPELPNYYTRGLTVLQRECPPEQAAKNELPNRPTEPVSFNNVKGLKISDSIFDYYLTDSNKTSSCIRFIYQGLSAFDSQDSINKKSQVYSQILSTVEFSDRNQ